MNVCNEMRKLRKWLDGHDIEWVDVSDDFGIDIGDIDIWICRTHFEVGGVHVSVINGHGSYGGFLIDEDKNQGYLEMMSDLCCREKWENPRGYLKANEIIKVIKKYMSKKESSG